MKLLISAFLVLCNSSMVLSQGTIRDVTDESTRGAVPVRKPAVHRTVPVRSESRSEMDSRPQQDTSPAFLAELSARQREADSLRSVLASVHRKLPTEADSRLRYETAVDYAWKILVFWLVLIVVYLVWAIHRYVYNYGLSDKEWKVLYPEIYETWFDRLLYRVFGRMVNMKTFRERRDEMVEYKLRLHREQVQMGSGDDGTPPASSTPTLLPEPYKNPYEKDSFGLPSGSVRGILALTALVMFLLIEGVNLYAPGNLEDQFSGLVTALQMVLAFYFGSKAVQVLQARGTTAKAAVAAKASLKATAPPAEAQPTREAAPGAPLPAQGPMPASPPAPPSEPAVLPASVSRARFANLVVLASDKTSAAPAEDTLSESTPLAKRVLALTASIETGSPFPDCFAGITGNFDGMGVSFGALQWNIGQGSLQSLWKEMRETHETEMITVLGDLYREFSQMLDGSQSAQMQWALQIQRRIDGRPNAWQIVDKWKAALQSLGRSPGMIQVQVQRADSLFHVSLASCQEYGLTLERGAALMFDIRVQNGSVDRGGAGQRIQSDYELLHPSLSETDMQIERMRIIARRRSEVSSPQWREDVLARKMTIAEGTGKIHGRSYDLEQEFSIGLRPITTVPAQEESHLTAVSA